LAAAILLEALVTSAYSQEADLEAKKAKYKELMISVGDDRYTKLKEEEAAQVIVSSSYTSPEIKALAQRFIDELLWSRVWKTANWVTPALYWGAFWLVGNYGDSKIISSNLWLVGTGVGLSILSGISSTFAEIFQPRLPATVIQSYNEDLRKALGLSYEDIHRL